MAKTKDEKNKYHGKQKCLRCGKNRRDRKNSAYCDLCWALLLLMNPKRGDNEHGKK